MPLLTTLMRWEKIFSASAWLYLERTMLKSTCFIRR